MGIDVEKEEEKVISRTEDFKLDYLDGLSALAVLLFFLILAFVAI